jgi:hypothetical protein
VKRLGWFLGCFLLVAQLGVGSAAGLGQFVPHALLMQGVLGSPNVSGDPIIKLGVLRFLEGINVINASVYEQGKLVFGMPKQRIVRVVCPAQPFAWDRFFVNFARADVGRTWQVLFCGIFEGRVTFHKPITGFRYHLVGGSVAGVLSRDFCSPAVHTDGWIDVDHEQVGAQLQLGMVAHHLVGLPVRFSAANGGACGGFCMVGRADSGDSGLTRVVNREGQTYESNEAEKNLNLIQRYGLFGSFGHTNLLTKIGLIMVLGLAAVGLTPIGFDWLFPISGRRRILGGLLLSVVGWGSLGLLFGIILSV